MAININKHVFKGHKTLLGSKYVTYGELELPLKFDLYPKDKNSFDWGHNGPASMQLAFSILHQINNDQDVATKLAVKFTQEVVKRLNSRDWILDSSDVIKWLAANEKELEALDKVNKDKSNQKSNMVLVTKQKGKSKTRKENIVKSICKELEITQKQLAEILEVPEGTVSSWAVKNEIPRLGKKAIEFYTISIKNQKNYR